MGLSADLKKTETRDHHLTIRLSNDVGEILKKLSGKYEKSQARIIEILIDNVKPEKLMPKKVKTKSTNPKERSLSLRITKTTLNKIELLAKQCKESKGNTIERIIFHARKKL